MKDDVVYNDADNLVFVRTKGDLIYVVCNQEKQQDTVIEKMTTDNCILEHYEEWDKGKDKKWILTFRVLDEFELRPEYN